MREPRIAPGDRGRAADQHQGPVDATGEVADDGDTEPEADDEVRGDRSMRGLSDVPNQCRDTEGAEDQADESSQESDAESPSGRRPQARFRCRFPIDASSGQRANSEPDEQAADQDQQKVLG
jgi:hypothetical protein